MHIKVFKRSAGLGYLQFSNWDEPDRAPHKSVGCMSVVCPTIYVTNTESFTLGGQYVGCMSVACSIIYVNTLQKWKATQ